MNRLPQLALLMRVLMLSVPATLGSVSAQVYGEPSSSNLLSDARSLLTPTYSRSDLLQNTGDLALDGLGYTFTVYGAPTVLASTSFQNRVVIRNSGSQDLTGANFVLNNTHALAPFYGIEEIDDSLQPGGRGANYLSGYLDRIHVITYTLNWPGGSSGPQASVSDAWQSFKNQGQALHPGDELEILSSYDAQAPENLTLTDVVEYEDIQLGFLRPDASPYGTPASAGMRTGIYIRTIDISEKLELCLDGLDCTQTRPLSDGESLPSRQYVALTKDLNAAVAFQNASVSIRNYETYQGRSQRTAFLKFMEAFAVYASDPNTAVPLNVRFDMGYQLGYQTFTLEQTNGLAHNNDIHSVYYSFPLPDDAIPAGTLIHIRAVYFLP